MKTSTFLPVFSGFYNTIWEPQTDSELEYINEQRAEKGLEPITDNECEWDNTEYEQRISRKITTHIGDKLKELEFITGYKFERLNSPKEYNFRNDAINVEFTTNKYNRGVIELYLQNHAEQFAKYLKDHYTTCSGFISSYPNTIGEFMENNPFAHFHKLGAILNFILLNEDSELELRIYEDVTGNTEGIQASNYSSLIGEA